LPYKIIGLETLPYKIKGSIGSLPYKIKGLGTLPFKIKGSRDFALQNASEVEKKVAAHTSDYIVMCVEGSSVRHTTGVDMSRHNRPCRHWPRDGVTYARVVQA